MTRFFKSLIRISSFQSKELIEIFRQPRLILTLVLGPFLIMYLFGIAYPERARTLKTIFIASDPTAFETQMQNFNSSFPDTVFDYVIESDQQKALARLSRNQVDLVIVVPDAQREVIENNDQAEFVVYHNEVDPFQVGFIQSETSLYIDEVNRQILQSEAHTEQVNSGSLQENLEDAIEKTQAIQKAVPAGDANTSSQVAELEKDLTDLHGKLATFRSLAPTTIVNPFRAKIMGLFGEILTVTEFFVPAVIVLLLQHVSITFSSLSIVRERRSGIMELFRISPISAFETLIGKYLSYMVFEIILAGVITALAVWLLKIPLAGHLLDYALAVTVLLFTSLGVGFLISLISETDTQAVQFSMLLLLASIFFSGFFMDLRLMRYPLNIFAWSLPATYGIRMLQDIMLRGSATPALVFLGITLIGLALFLINWLLLKRKMGNQAY
jgi:ABC-2 type transport system permease protein